MFVLQATIGIDFLSKTMYLEDRTVSPVCYCNLHHSNWSGIKTAIEACFCLLSHHSTLFIDSPSFLFCFFTHFVEHVIVFLVPIIISRFCFPSIPWLDHELPPCSHICFVAGHRSGCSSGIQPDRSVSAASSPVTSATQPPLWWFMT